MFVSVSAPTFDVSGSVILNANAESDLASFTRRVSRNTTLDGGVIVTDGGYTASDRTLTVVLNPSLTTATTLARLCQTYQTLTVSLREGCYSCAAESFRSVPGKTSVVFLVISKLSA